VPIYKAALPKKTAALTEKPDIVTFTSSSTVKNFITLYGKTALAGLTLASIGPVTSNTLKSLGFDVHIEAKRYDVPGLLEAIVRHVEAKDRGKTV
jgi:uroporphyrinogen III methyltransferase/synthase